MNISVEFILYIQEHTYAWMGAFLLLLLLAIVVCWQHRVCRYRNKIRLQLFLFTCALSICRKWKRAKNVKSILTMPEIGNSNCQPTTATLTQQLLKCRLCTIWIRSAARSVLCVAKPKGKLSFLALFIRPPFFSSAILPFCIWLNWTIAGQNSLWHTIHDHMHVRENRST